MFIIVKSLLIFMFKNTILDETKKYLIEKGNNQKTHSQITSNIIIFLYYSLYRRVYIYRTYSNIFFSYFVEIYRQLHDQISHSNPLKTFIITT